VYSQGVMVYRSLNPRRSTLAQLLHSSATTTLDVHFTATLLTVIRMESDRREYASVSDPPKVSRR
jgi:hypothetical protein